jgi:hypothetical protein
MEDQGFTHIEKARDIPSGPFFYVLHESIRNVHPNSRVPMRPNIAHIQQIQSATPSSDIVKLTFKGLFGYWGLQEGTGERIYLGGGRVEDKGQGRERAVILRNCFTTINPLLEAYFPLDEQAKPVRIHAEVLK